MLPTPGGGRVKRNHRSELPGPQFGISLLLYSPVLLGANFALDLTKKAQSWRRTIRLQGGYWQGTFRIVAPLPELVDYFYNWLGWHLEESVQGVKSWEGMIYELVLNTPNASRVRSLDKLANHVRMKYVNGAGADQITSAASVQASIDRYGQREEIQDAGKFDSVSAEAMRASYLAEYAWPWGRPQASGGEDSASLDVTVCGYVFTANWRHTTQANDATDTVHDWISDILTNDCATWLSVGTLEANTTSIERSVDDYKRCWELMQDVIGVGDASGNLYRLFVGNNRYVYYELVNKIPDYYVVKGEICERLAATEAMNPWFVKPGIFRDMDYPVSYMEQGSYLNNVRDVLVEEVSCGVGSGLTWQALDFSESAQLAALKEISGRGAANSPGGRGGSFDRTISDEQLEKWGMNRREWWAIKATEKGRALRASIKKKKKRG